MFQRTFSSLTLFRDNLGLDLFSFISTKHEVGLAEFLIYFTLQKFIEFRGRNTTIFIFLTSSFVFSFSLESLSETKWYLMSVMYSFCPVTRRKARWLTPDGAGHSHGLWTEWLYGIINRYILAYFWGVVSQCPGCSLAPILSIWPLLGFLVVVCLFWSHSCRLRTDSYFCAQDWLLAVLRGLYMVPGIETRSAIRKANAPPLYFGS